LSTSRPFLVAIRTRNPCRLARRLTFGWKVRLPFFDLAIRESRPQPESAIVSAEPALHLPRAVLE
jgi:hypothetical protein